MREFVCAAFLLPDIHPQKAQESDLYGQCGCCNLPRTQGAHVRLSHPTWTDRLAKSLGATLIDFLSKDTRSHPLYLIMYERPVRKEVCLPCVVDPVVPYFQEQAINLLVSVLTHSVAK
jgi:hypothetical protein